MIDSTCDTIRFVFVAYHTIKKGWFFGSSKQYANMMKHTCHNNNSTSQEWKDILFFVPAFCSRDYIFVIYAFVIFDSLVTIRRTISCGYFRCNRCTVQKLLCTTVRWRDETRQWKDATQLGFTVRVFYCTVCKSPKILYPRSFVLNKVLARISNP